MKIISRIKAKEKGLKRYFTGEPCKHGHIVYRDVRSCTCSKCKQEGTKTWVKQNSNKILSVDKKWRSINKTRTRKYSKRYRQSNPAMINKIAKQTRQRLTAYYYAQCALRRARKLQAIPRWYDQEKYLINELYSQCKQLTVNTGIAYNVDHIIPLQSDIVCGLHCFDNLQILTAKENEIKNNTFLIS